MKSVIKIIMSLLLIILITIICCIVFIPNVPNFKEMSEYKYIDNNKENIYEVIARTVTLLGEHCYKIDKDIGIEILNGISFKKKTNMTCTDSDMYLEFYFKNNEKRVLSFECGNMHYKDEKYILKNEVILYNEDQYVFDDITDGMIVVSEEDKIECR